MTAHDIALLIVVLGTVVCALIVPWLLTMTR